MRMMILAVGVHMITMTPGCGLRRVDQSAGVARRAGAVARAVAGAAGVVPQAGARVGALLPLSASPTLCLYRYRCLGVRVEAA